MRVALTVAMLASCMAICSFVILGCQTNGAPEREAVEDAAPPAELVWEDGEHLIEAPETDRPAIRRTHMAMATEYEIIAFPRTADEDTMALIPIIEEAFREIDDVDNRFSTWKATSQATYVNNHAAERPVRVAPDFFDLVARSKEHWETSMGAFDVTVGPLMELWGRYGDVDAVPSQAELEDVLQRVGMDKVELNPAERTIAFTEEGIQLDFGGIAKGYAVGLAADVLARYGVESALVNAGTSSITALGAPPGTDGWPVHIRHPYEPDARMDTVYLNGEAMSTSGCYENLIDIGGDRVCDIIDPRDGRPVGHMLSVTAIGPDGADADAISTALMVLGVDAAREFAQGRPGWRILVTAVPADGAVEPERINF